MPDSVISKESFFYIRVEAVCKGEFTTCSPDMDVIEAARLMQDHDLTAVVVVDESGPIGVFSIRDLRKCLADFGGALAGCKVRDNMGHGLITIHRRDYVYEAVFSMARHNVFRLGVVDDTGTLVGIVNATDLLKIQTCTPLFLYQEIEEARTIDDLRTLGVRLHDIVETAVRVNADIRNVVQLISGFNDAIALRLISLLEHGEGVRLPEGAAYLVLGSEGRREQTLRTDQDNAIVYDDDLPADRLREVERFAARLVDALEEIGVPRCPGDIMASSPQWCHSLGEWKKLVREWIAAPTPENVLNFGMIQDLRPLHGDLDLGIRLRDHILTSVRRQGNFFSNMADHVVRFPSPFTMFGRIRVESSGEYKGKVDLKKAGIFAITKGASLLALESGFIGGTTWEKLSRLKRQGIFTGSDLETIEEAFSFLIKLRLQVQMRDLSESGEVTNHVDLRTLTGKEREQFRQALRGVNAFLWIFRDRYNLDYNAI
jgi:CBS domain-containing protein